jgi:hypothetical protein
VACGTSSPSGQPSWVGPDEWSVTLRGKVASARLLDSPHSLEPLWQGFHRGLHTSTRLPTRRYGLEPLCVGGLRSMWSQLADRPSCLGVVPPLIANRVSSNLCCHGLGVVGLLGMWSQLACRPRGLERSLVRLSTVCNQSAIPVQDLPEKRRP